MEICEAELRTTSTELMAIFCGLVAVRQPRLRMAPFERLGEAAWSFRAIDRPAPTSGSPKLRVPGLRAIRRLGPVNEPVRWFHTSPDAALPRPRMYRRSGW